MPSILSPGSYTIRWMIDTRRVQERGLTTLRAAQIAAYALQPRFGTLAGDSVQPRDAEFIVNVVSDDVITGVVRLQLTAPHAKEAMGEAILNAFRSQGVPDAAPHLTVSEVPTPLGIAAAPLVGMFALPLAAAAAVNAGSRNAVRTRFGNVIIGVEPRVRNDARPSAGATVAGAALAASSRRISSDPTRDGNIGASAAAEAARAAADAIAMPTWLIVLLSAGGVVAGGVLLYAGYRRISGK